jgi:hypothetical protein
MVPRGILGVSAEVCLRWSRQMLQLTVMVLQTNLAWFIGRMHKSNGGICVDLLKEDNQRTEVGRMAIVSADT